MNYFLSIINGNRILAKFIYVVCFNIYRIILKNSIKEIKYIWFRNSLVLSYWFFGKSDIDITIVINNHDVSLIKKISSLHNKIKKIIPIIGEAIIFPEEKKDVLLNLINPLELNRDKSLKMNFRFQKEVQLADKIVFLNKFIISNWNKKDINKYRQKKIDYFAIASGLNPHVKYKFEDLIAELAKLLGEEPVNFIQNYSLVLDKNYQNFSSDMSPALYSLLFNQLCYIDLNSTLDNLQKNVLEKTIYWEIWGCYSYQAFLDLPELKEHFERIKINSKKHTSENFQNKLDFYLRDLELK